MRKKFSITFGEYLSFIKRFFFLMGFLPLLINTFTDDKKEI